MDSHFVWKDWIAFVKTAFRGNGIDGFHLGVGPLCIQSDYLIGIGSAEFTICRVVFVRRTAAVWLGVPTSEYFAVVFEFVWFQRRCGTARSGWDFLIGHASRAAVGIIADGVRI